MAITTILFDFGGVFTHSPFTAVDEYADSIGASGETIQRLVFGAYDSDSDHPWHRMERGELTLEEGRRAIAGLSRDAGREVDIFEVLLLLGRGGGGVREALVDYTRQLNEAGYRLGIITNNLREFRDGWRSLVPVDELFHFVVDSCEVGMRKPDPAIYRHALELAGAAPEQAVFLDDAPGNVRAAADIGMHAIHVSADEQRTIDELRALLERSGRQ